MQQATIASIFLLTVIVASPLIHGFSSDLPLARMEKVAFGGAKFDTSLYTFGSSSAAEFEFPEDMSNNNGRLPLSENAGDHDDQRYQRQDTRQQSRERRLRREEEAKVRFVTGDDLHLLRQEVLGLRDSLNTARRTGETRRVRELERAILRAQARDAEFVYKVALERMEKAEAAGHAEEVEQLKEEAMIARTALPQFNLEGLWVGKYGDQGYEMINVTYVGNTLVAYKVTSKKNVPKGEISFKVDLSPKTTPNRNPHSDGAVLDNVQDRVLEPIELGDSAAQQWGSKYLQRFTGKGQVSAEGFVNSQWMEGQLIIVKEYFSFAWLPISHQVFFGRPSAELTMKLLSEANNNRSKESKLRDYLEKCVEETDLLNDEMEVSDGPFFSHDQQDYYDRDGFFE